MITGHTYIENEYAEGVEKYGAYCKPERFGPPELCYATEDPTEHPTVTRMAFGKGYGLCLPWNPGTNYYADGNETFRLFIGDVLENLCCVKSAGTCLTPMVEITHGRKENTELVHFVNGSGHFGNSFFEPPVLSDQSMEIAWPYDTVTCRNIDEPGNVAYKLENGKLTITVPRLGYHACIVIRRD